MTITNSRPISVIVPVYNHEHYVADTINSIINQTFSNIELIVINDGSTDNSYQVVMEMEQQCNKRFSNFVCIDKDNEGAVKTLNQGIRIAQGEYIYIIASDDLAEPDALEILFTFLSENSDYALAVGGNVIIDDNGVECFWNKDRELVYSKDQSYFMSFDDFLRKSASNVDFFSEEFGRYDNLLIGNHIPNGYLLDKKTVVECGGYVGDGVLEDLNLMLQISKRKKFKFIDKPLFRYRWHATNSIKNTVKIGQAQHKTIMQERDYCFTHGYISLWIKRAYWPSIKYYFEKLKMQFSGS